MTASEALAPAHQASTAVRPSENRRRLRRFFRDPLGVAGACVFLAVCLAAALAPVLTPYGFRDIVGVPFQGPSAEHWLGTDQVGRDLFTRLLYGGRASMLVGVATSTFALVIGVPWGLLSGYLGGRFDTISMRLVDGILAFPGIILALAVVAVAGPSLPNVVLAIGVTHIPRFARLIRGEVLSLKSREFVNAEIVMGAQRWYILRRTILPNTFSVLSVQFTLTFAGVILTEASLSFLGLGTQPPTPSWGNMLSMARNFLDIAPLHSIVSGGAIFIVVLSIGLVGDALRDVLDPRGRTFETPS